MFDADVKLSGNQRIGEGAKYSDPAPTRGTWNSKGRVVESGLDDPEAPIGLVRAASPWVFICRVMFDRTANRLAQPGTLQANADDAISLADIQSANDGTHAFFQCTHSCESVGHLDEGTLCHTLGSCASLPASAAPPLDWMDTYVCEQSMSCPRLHLRA
jgi:hypothetical protein